MFAVVEIQGQQFKVEENTKYNVPRINQDPDSEITFDRVLIFGDDSDSFSSSLSQSSSYSQSISQSHSNSHDDMKKLAEGALDQDTIQSYESLARANGYQDIQSFMNDYLPLLKSQIEGQ